METKSYGLILAWGEQKYSLWVSASSFLGPSNIKTSSDTKDWKWLKCLFRAVKSLKRNKKRKWSTAFISKGSYIYDVHKKWPSWWSIVPVHPQKWAKDLLRKNKRIRKPVTNFKALLTPFRVEVINVWS